MYGRAWRNGLLWLTPRLERYMPLLQHSFMPAVQICKGGLCMDVLGHPGISIVHAQISVSA